MAKKIKEILETGEILMKESPATEQSDDSLGSSGNLYLTNKRLIYIIKPSRLSFGLDRFYQPFILPLNKIKEAKSGWGNQLIIVGTDRPFMSLRKARYKFRPSGKKTNEEWVTAIEQARLGSRAPQPKVVEQPLQPPTKPSERRFCPSCGTPVKLGDRFCGRCGAKLS